MSDLRRPGPPEFPHSQARKRIFFDVYELAPGTGKSMGVYNYSRHLLNAIVRSERRDFELVVACNAAALADFSVPPGPVRVEFRILGERGPGIVQRLAWTYWGAAIEARRCGADIYFSPRGFLPYLLGLLRPGLRSVVTIHDLIRLWYQERFPRYFNRAEQWFICRSLVRSCMRADDIITISNASADDLRRRTGTRRPVHVVPNGISLDGPMGADVPGRFFFAIASSLPHKNAENLIEGYRAYRALAAKPIPLVVSGLKECDVSGVQVVQNLPESLLQAHYRDAVAFVYLSLAEGFGLPPLEAMAHGTPVLCSDIEVLRETTQGCASFVNPESPGDIGAALLALDNDSERLRRQEHKAERMSLARSYSWTENARRHMDCLVPLE